MKKLTDAADLLQIPAEELVTLCEGCEIMGMPQPRYADDGEGYFHDEEWQTIMDCIIAGNLLNWPDEYTPPGLAPNLPKQDGSGKAPDVAADRGGM